MKYLLEGQETDRLKFRLLDRKDFNVWLELFNDQSIPRFIGMKKIPTPQEQCETWFSREENKYKNGLGGMNVLIHKESNQLVGQCGLHVQQVDNRTELEIGYSILPKFWKLGYATEAARKCRDYAFENNFSDHLISIVHIENIRSEKVALKNGMKKTKRTSFREMPVNIFRIDKEDWRKITNN